MFGASVNNSLGSTECGIAELWTGRWHWLFGVWPIQDRDAAH